MTSDDATPVEIEPGVYEHFKGMRYEVFGTARHSETEEVFVSYRTLYGDHSFWVRPIAMFTEHVERDGYSAPGSVASSSAFRQIPDAAEPWLHDVTASACADA